jgi:two-component sensor histidine kinase
VLKNLTIFLFFSLCLQLYSQEPIRFTTKQGLPTNHIYDIQEDANGFMWFATKRGLVKYDGETFRTYTIQDGLPNNDTWKLDLDYQGRLLYFSKSAYQGYILNDSIYKFSTDDKTVISPSSFSNSKKGYWFWGNGLKKIENNKIFNDSFSYEEYFTFKSKISENNSLPNTRNMQFLLIPEKKEVFVINKIENKIAIYDWNFKYNSSITIEAPGYFKESDNFTDSGVICNQIAFCAFENGVLFIDFKKNKTSFILFSELFGVAKPNYFRCKVLKNEFQISIPGHLAIFDYQLRVKEKFSFSEQLGQHSFKDSRGHVWLIDISNGISLIPNTQIKATAFLKNLKVQKINTEGERFYAGVNNKGIYSLNRYNHKVKQLISFNIPHTEIYQIKKDRSTNNMRIVTARDSYDIVDENLVRIRVNNIINNKVDNFSASGAKDIVTFNNATYLISTYIIKSDVNEKNSKLISTNKGLSQAETYNNKLYLAGSNGLYQLENDSLLKIQPNNNLLQTSILSLLSKKENLIAGTDGRGIYFYNGNKTTYLKNTDGFSIQRIIEKQNELWFATNKGVHKLLLDDKDLENSKIVNSFYESDGLLQNNINDIYIEKDTLYAATDVGISKINTKDTLYQQKPKLYFKTKSDTLIYKNEARDNIEITFGLHNYVNQEYVKYEYRLLPSQKKWTTTQTKNLNFSNLSPNLYELQVKVVDQHFNETIVSQYINIVPRWWQTTTVKISFSLFGLLCFLGILKGIKIQIQKKERAKAQLDKKIAGLELQALRSQMNPHFVHNSLNAIQYYIQRNEVEQSENYLVKFSKLIRMFFEYSRRQSITIKEELELLRNYLDIEKLRFEEKLSYSISVCDAIDEEERLIPSMLLQPIVENAVNHGLFHKLDNGCVSISFKKIDDDTFQVIVKDDGIGLYKAKELHKRSSKNYQSNSSAVLQERLELLNQSKDWEIEYEIIDQSTIDKDTTGTIVRLTFKDLNV